MGEIRGRRFTLTGVIPKLDTPIFGDIFAGSTTVKLNWGTGLIPDVVSILERADNIDFTVGLISLYTGLAKTFTDETVQPLTQYYYRLKTQKEDYLDSNIIIVPVETVDYDPNYMPGFTPWVPTIYEGHPELIESNGVYTTHDGQSQLALCHEFTIPIGGEIAYKAGEGHDCGIGCTEEFGASQSGDRLFMGTFSQYQEGSVYGINYEYDAWGDEHNPMPNLGDWVILKRTSLTLLEVFSTPDGVSLTKVGEMEESIDISIIKCSIKTMMYPQGRGLTPII